MRRIEEIRPIKVITTPGGDTVLDMGQNMTGWCRLKVNGQKGTIIKLRHGEVLDKSGNFYTENLRSAKQTITYTCRGGGQEVYEPSFTFQGFRYVAVSGYPGQVTTDMITGIVVHSDTERTGYFSCSDSLVNRLYQNILWVQKCNMVDVATDCPQRDERCGWLGDVQLFAPTACSNRLMAGFYTKWLKDLKAEQAAAGFVPNVVPYKMGPGFPVIGWSDAAVIMPWLIYRRYGDTRILEEQYQSMKDWVETMRRDSDKGDRFVWSRNIQFYGDWLSFKSDAKTDDYPGAFTDKDYLATAYFYHSADLMQKTAEVLGRKEDAVNYGELKEKIRKYFLQEYVTSTGRVSPNTQTAYAVALSFGLLEGKQAGIAAGRLAENVKNVGHITTGLMGTAEICPALSDHGYINEAYKLLLSKEYPSWLYMVRMGGTTIWERWDGMRPDSTFQSVHMNSFNHPALGSVGNWLYNKVAGIDLDPEVPGYKSVIIKPFPGGGLDRAEASYESLYGTVRSKWRTEKGKLFLSVEIPVNTSAKVYIPSTSSELKMNGEQIRNAEKVIVNGQTWYFNRVEAGSGKYEIESTWTNQ